MLYTVKCPKCGEVQKNLDLDETEGSFICSKCGAENKIDLNKLKKELSK